MYNDLLFKSFRFFCFSLHQFRLEPLQAVFPVTKDMKVGLKNQALRYRSVKPQDPMVISFESM